MYKDQEDVQTLAVF